jgi:hypothetical protein
LRAAETFEKSHFSRPPLINVAEISYVEDYFLTHSPDSVLELSKKALEKVEVG